MLTLILTLFSFCSFAGDLRHEVIPNSINHKNKAEFFWQAPEGKGPFPVYIIVHGHQGTLRKGAANIARGNALRVLAENGFIAVAVSQAGYGLTSGDPDHAGVESQNALITVIRFFQKNKIAAPDKIILFGTSMGATLSAITAARGPGIAGIILENGMYDVRAGLNYLSLSARSDPGIADLFQLLNTETGSGLEERSALFQADKIKAKVLLLAGLGDRVALPDQSLRFHEALQSAGVDSEFVLFPFTGHNIPLELKVGPIGKFVKKILSP